VEQNNRPHVLIIGGGVAGPALALFLQKAGISCAVYEAYPYTERVGAGLNIASNGMKVLAELGLAQTLIARGTPTYVNRFQNELGWTLAEIPYGDPVEFGQPCVSMSRATLFEALASEMKHKEIDIYYEKRLTFITDDQDEVVAHFEDGTSADGGLLVGADGVHSAVRGHILPEGPKPDYVGIIGIGGFVPLTALPPIPKKELGALTYTFGPKGFFGWSGGDSGTVMWWANLPQEKEFTKVELADLDWPAVQRELLARYRGYPKPIEAAIGNTTSLLRLNVYDILSLRTWHRDRIVLIGDAAHAVSPNSGQGASLALEDAMYLAKLLRDVAPNYKRAFDQFETDRKERVEKIVAEGRERARDKEIMSWFRSRMRDIMIIIFVRLYGKKSQRWKLDYKIDWDSNG